MPMAEKYQGAIIKTTNKGRVTFEQALAVFHEIADMEHLPFGYVETGCFERADLICDMLDKAGYLPYKVWTFKKDGLIRCRSGQGLLTWNFHVAPVIEAEIHEGIREPLVIDPALFDGPVRIKQWRGAMENATTPLMYPFKETPKPFNRSLRKSRRKWEKALAASERVRPLLMREQNARRIVIREVYESDLKAEFKAKSGKILKPGKTWVTLPKPGQ